MKSLTKTGAGALATVLLLVAALGAALGGGLASTLASAIATITSSADGGQPDPAKIPTLARQLLPVLTARAAACPGLPAVWVIAEVQAESSWNPREWTDDVNGGTAGLYQINQAEWTSLGGRPWDTPAHTPPPDGADVFDPATNLTLGIRLACGHLQAMTRYLTAAGKPVTALDAMLICHLAGCSRVTNSASGIPTAGEAGCDTACVDLVHHYLDTVHRYVTQYQAGLTTAPTSAATAAIRFAQAQLGLPYAWGGNGPADGGFDCSGLTHAAYQAAGITLPRTAQTQYDAGPHLPPGQLLLPGDLVFYGSPSHIHHVGLYLGDGQMIDAPDFGLTVRVDPAFRARDYAGATRPAARHAS
jgi:catechol 2,3-dioxygenase-like lactoylglutathione lyase family enzyme